MAKTDRTYPLLLIRGVWSVYVKLDVKRPGIRAYSSVPVSPYSTIDMKESRDIRLLIKASLKDLPRAP